MNDTKSLKSIRVVSTIVFVCIITLLAWQSDDACHGKESGIRKWICI